MNVLYCAGCNRPFKDILEDRAVVGNLFDDVSCDGCHKFFHRTCLVYQLVNVDWDTQPKAYAFCTKCNDFPGFEL